MGSKARDIKFKVTIDLQGHFQGQKGQKPNFVRTSKIRMFSRSSKSGCSHKVQKIQGHKWPWRPLSRPKRPKTHLCHKIWMVSQSSANELNLMLSQSSVIELNSMLSQSSVIKLNLILSQSSVNKLNLMLSQSSVIELNLTLSQSSVIQLKLGLKSQRGPLTQKIPPFPIGPPQVS